MDSPGTGPPTQAPIRSHPPSGECQHGGPPDGGQIPTKAHSPGSGESHQPESPPHPLSLGGGLGRRPRTEGAVPTNRLYAPPPLGVLPPTLRWGEKQSPFGLLGDRQEARWASSCQPTTFSCRFVSCRQARGLGQREASGRVSYREPKTQNREPAGRSRPPVSSQTRTPYNKALRSCGSVPPTIPRLAWRRTSLLCSLGGRTLLDSPIMGHPIPRSKSRRGRRSASTGRLMRV